MKRNSGPVTQARPVTDPVLHDLQFRGWTGGRGNLTWGQQAILLVLRWYGAFGAEHTHWFDIVQDVAVPQRPDGARQTLDEVLAAVSKVLRDFESLRTVLAPMTPAELDGCHGLTADCSRPHYVQLLVAEGSVPVRLIHATADSAAAARDELASCLTGEPFDLRRGLPVRVGILLTDGAPATVVLAFSHFAADGVSTVLVADALRAGLRGQHGAAASSPLGLQPLEIARQERSARARQQSQRAVERWLAKLSTVSALRGERPKEPRKARWIRVSLHSTAAAAGAAALAQRLAVSDNAVYLAAASVALSQTGIATVCGWKMVTSNRFAPGYEVAVGALFQDSLVVIDGRKPLVDVIAAAGREILASLRHSRFSAFDLAQALEHTGSEHADGLRLVFNDLRVLDTPRGRGRDSGRSSDAAADSATGQNLGSPGPKLLCSLLGESRLETGDPVSLQDWSVFLNLDQHDNVVELEMINDAEVVSEAATAALLRLMEQTLVLAAATPYDVRS